MADFKEFVKSQWIDIKGNAKWDFIKVSFTGVFMIPLILAAILKFIRDEPLWLVLAISIAVLLLGLIAWIALMWFILGREKKTEKPKRKTEKEKSKEWLHEFTKKQFPDRFAPELSAEKYREQTIGTNFQYSCRIKVEAHTFMDNFKLEIIDFEPIPTVAQFGCSPHQLPDRCPIILKPRGANIQAINQGTSEFFELFKLVRTGNVPSIAISEFSYFPVSIRDSRNPSNVIFNDYNFTIKATAKNVLPKTERFKFTFNRDHLGVASFDIEKIIAQPSNG